MAKFCTNCGAEVKDGLAFCTECGTSASTLEPSPQKPKQPTAMQPEEVRTTSATPPVQAPTAAQPVYQPQPAPSPVYAPLAEQAPPKNSRYAVVGTGAFFGTILLFSIPIIGWIICIVFACGGTRNQNKRNLARAFLIFFVIMLVLSVLLYFAMKALTDWIWQAFNEATGGEFGNWKDIFEQFGNGEFNDIPDMSSIPLE